MSAETPEPNLFNQQRVRSPSSQTAAVQMNAILASELINKRQQHPAWQILAARRGPLVLSCLKSIFDAGQSEVPLEEARMLLSRLLGAHANDPEFEINAGDFAAQARKELRAWIHKGLLVERGGFIIATDSLQTAFQFIDGIQERMMTSTASRLSTVQQKVESLEAGLNPSKERRLAYLNGKIADLQRELEQVQQGKFEVLEGERAQEEIRELYTLAMSLRNDFRRVEDSYREADRSLRQSIISEEQNRGEVLERLLAANEALLNTPEGRVFNGFHQQIARSTELDQMRERIRTILAVPSATGALSAQQAKEMRGLVARLVDESQNVMQARSRSEKDVRGFIKTGLAGEHHRVGDLLQQIFETVLQIDWSKQAVKRAPSPLAPIAPALPNLPFPERLDFKALDDPEETRLNLEQQHGSLDVLADSYLENLNELDRSALFQETLAVLRTEDRPLTLGELSEHLPPEYDLETLAYWITLARESDCKFERAKEDIDLSSKENPEPTRFRLPTVALNAANIENITYQELE
ncbi:DUF3375 domain-containing protein [Coraliomargarita sp. SDUM461003]|uniref:DUF3375 domain-containing protein n=1 Tax=Thalassobacterium maritimum TaxID=3041265 RepID=A0ABU1AXT3_9BACT|nr:DUF3375 domain-containing protein [Coraliomargarita sp. SDUM461003]MDQ8208427.1 DUF3375 domain-containing protein [Coraliomargarita sp. SDUM461003]